jgi:toxin-antitoxin system PIN domain toxin
MTGYLLDVNVLIALFDPSHVHHDAAHGWFSNSRSKGWATCPLTENAVVRILSSPSYPSGTLLADNVMERLAIFRRSGQHQFWPDDISILDAKRFNRTLIRGPKQLTDIYLLGLAEAHDGCLATLDRSISPGVLMSKAADRLELIG